MAGPAELDPELEAEIQRACFEAIRGESPGAALARRVERDCIAVLKRHGYDQAVVRAESNVTATMVNILLPRPGQPVRQVRMRLAHDGGRPGRR